MPRHDKASPLLRSKLFDGLDSFAELEERIKALPTGNARGDAFEVFAEAYLATQKTAQANDVWPFDCIPVSVKERLALDTGRDMGVDGVFETVSGEYNAYQAKFRTGRPSLTWDELSTFMGLTEQVSQRVLFTNCDDLPSVMSDRAGFYCIRGNDLDRLEPRDLAAIQRWLETGVVAAERKQPLPHQSEALDAILDELKEHDRTTAIMACGTGKTLVALWAAERMGCGTVLVLVPSLALVRQTLHEWLKETSWRRLSYLCVCSDPTVAKGVGHADDLIVRQSDLDFQVSTDSDTVRQFLSANLAVTKLIFSTYQSAHVVAEAMDGHRPFDLGVFDEAHRTAGREGTKFGFALTDKNLPIGKRLFMTATPRHYDIRKRDKEGDTKLVFSMDVPEVYGGRAHTLTFAKAAAGGIICNYKVLISVVTSEMVNEERLKRSEVMIAGDPVKARQVANQVALQKAVEEYGITRAFTFHRNVASAKSFTAPGGEGICAHLPEFQAFHVNGKMRTARRESFLKAFEEADQAVISNARCLTEGVDVPAVDMVAFMSPKRSRVDIVQATGRAMRKDPQNQSKRYGYILVPLFVEQKAGETIEDALDRTGFDEVWNVLQAMQEQDAELADVIRAMREERGRKRGYDDSRFREKVEVLGSEISLETLRKAITAECVDQLGVTWDERFGELVSYKEKFGDCNVPQGWSDNPALGKWVHKQRTMRKNGKLREDRINRLNQIGFTWDPHEASWEEMFAALVDYKDAHGDCNVPINWLENPNLGTWVNKQRTMQNNLSLREDRMNRLNEIGFVWDAIETFWEEMFAALVDYKEVHGSCNVPVDWPENPKFGIWISNQRRLRKKGKLSESRINRLDKIGFIWDPYDASWEEMYAALVEYKDTHGNCKVPYKWPEDPRLGKWANKQRTRRKKGTLSEDRIKRLDGIGFQWTLRKRR